MKHILLVWIYHVQFVDVPLPKSMYPVFTRMQYSTERCYSPLLILHEQLFSINPTCLVFSQPNMPGFQEKSLCIWFTNQLCMSCFQPALCNWFQPTLFTWFPINSVCLISNQPCMSGFQSTLYVWFPINPVCLVSNQLCMFGFQSTLLVWFPINPECLVFNQPCMSDFQSTLYFWYPINPVCLVSRPEAGARPDGRTTTTAETTHQLRPCRQTGVWRQKSRSYQLGHHTHTDHWRGEFCSR